MPNWCYNTLEIQGEPKALNKMLKQVEVTENEATQHNSASQFSFNSIIPMPASEKDNWYEWRIANWGTKWGADIQYDTFSEWESGSVYIDFNTAWSPANPVIKALSKQHPKLTFYWRYHEESYAYWGIHELKKGEYLSFTEGEFNTCYEYNEFGLTHHECLSCQEWIDECNNSDVREIEACESCKAEAEQLNAELTEMEKELWA